MKDTAGDPRMERGGVPQGAAELFRHAQTARQNAYARYSNFPVGAALLDNEGRVHTGVNVENASFGLTICAERTALFSAVAMGRRSFRAIAIAGPEDDVPCYPCGACRQVLHEFAPTLTIILADPGGHLRTTSLDTLLPDAFGPDRVEAQQSSESDPLARLPQPEAP